VAVRVRRGPWVANETKQATLHWLIMGMGEHVSPLLGAVGIALEVAGV